MKTFIKTSYGTAVLGVCFLLAITLINWSSKQFNLITQSMQLRTQLAAISGAGSGLVAHYTFDDGTATDNSGNGNNGTVNGATYVDGKAGQALSFDGDDGHVAINSNPISNYASANSFLGRHLPHRLEFFC